MKAKAVSEKINKIYKPLGRLTKERGSEREGTNYQHQGGKEDIITAQWDTERLRVINNTKYTLNNT